ncbi:ANTAR domain-containing response regulator [Stieleria varia]|uniref:Putative transcriptional regulatory protein pdtaR n=1 Tax=Stieleria varia TaxID=2528005 RepID=A0A5C5ZP73_9BACT|nr:response regulator [Stieleria varia]TWT89259.1 putative transcriptional regulatory protein pdtaR [Stieleria varia]
MAVQGESLSVCIADDDQEMRERLKECLTGLGHHVVSASDSGAGLLQSCARHRPDFVVTDVVMSDMDGFSVVAKIYRQRPLPLIIVSKFDDQEFFQRASREHILAYLVKPIDKRNLAAAITIARARFDELYLLQREFQNLRQALEDRKMIERAKGVMMRDWGLTEQEAFTRLKLTARSGNQKMIDVARTILLASGACGTA